MDENTEAPHSKLPDPETWVDQYGDYLYRFALFRVKDPLLAEELVQETFLAALNSQKNYKGRSSARTWLIAILKHKVIDQFRKQKTEDSREDMEAFPESVDHFFDKKGRWSDRPASWSTNPLKAYEQREFMDAFYRCLSDLPKRLSEAFVLREMEGLSTEEICKHLDITATNCWVRLYRARMHLRRCLDVNWVAL